MQLAHGRLHIDRQTGRADGRNDGGWLQGRRLRTHEELPDARMGALGPDEQLAGRMRAVLEDSRDEGAVGVDLHQTFSSLRHRPSAPYQGKVMSLFGGLPEYPVRWR